MSSASAISLYLLVVLSFASAKTKMEAADINDKSDVMKAEGKDSNHDMHKRQAVTCGATYNAQGYVQAPGTLNPNLCVWNFIPTLGWRSHLQITSMHLTICKNDSYGIPYHYLAGWKGLKLLGPYCGGMLPPSQGFTGMIVLIYKTAGGGSVDMAFSANFTIAPASVATVCDYSANLMILQTCNAQRNYAKDVGTSVVTCNSSLTNTNILIDGIFNTAAAPSAFTVLASLFASNVNPWIQIVLLTVQPVCAVGLQNNNNGSFVNGVSFYLGNATGIAPTFANPQMNATLCYTRNGPIQPAYEMYACATPATVGRVMMQWVGGQAVSVGEVSVYSQN